MMGKLPDENFVEKKKKSFRVLALCNFGQLKTCDKDISKGFIASSFKLDHLTEDVK